jgi:UDP:flavonoid glycosyltransferase YjiC (YdhE family)
MPPVDCTCVFYISGHGFGHASRSIAVINALLARRPGVRVIIRSAVAPWLVARTAHPAVELAAVETDTGVVQIDSLRLDAAASLARAGAFMASFDARVAAEAAFLRAEGATLVVADLPPLGIAAAAAAGIPGMAFGNFTWDWIYAHYPGGEPLARAIGEIYAHTTLALRLPMWGGFATMPAVREVPFVARRARRDRDHTRRALGLPRDARVVLVSFGGYGLSGVTRPQTRGYHVLWPGDVDEAAMSARGFRYEDLVGASDVVVSKPGYGIISDCLANGAALLYTSRGDFREYPVLVEAMPRVLRCAFIEQEALFAGDWTPSLDRLLAQPPPPETPATNGADIVAALISP